MGRGGVLRARGVEVAVGLLRRGDDVDDGVDVVAQPAVGVGLQQIGGTLDGLVGVGIVEGEGALGYGEGLRGVLQVPGGVLEVGVAPRLLTLAEGQGHGDTAAGLQALAPEGGGRHLHLGERDGGDGIARRGRSGAHGWAESHGRQSEEGLHYHGLSVLGDGFSGRSYYFFFTYVQHQATFRIAPSSFRPFLPKG